MKRKEMIENMRLPRNIGEPGRSAYERGYEHLNELASFSSKSHMLRHMLHKHEGQDFSGVKWGVFVLKYLKRPLRDK